MPSLTARQSLTLMEVLSCGDATDILGREKIWLSSGSALKALRCKLHHITTQKSDTPYYRVLTGVHYSGLRPHRD